MGKKDLVEKPWFKLIIIIVFFILLSVIYLRNSWLRYENIVQNEAISLADSLKVMLHAEHITELTSSTLDLEDPQYISTKKSLIELAEADNPVHKAYILVNNGDELIYLMDSSREDTPSYSPPGKAYGKVNDDLLALFNNGKVLLTPAETDKWGSWKTVFVPVKGITEDRVIGVFAIDYSVTEWNASIWNHMISDIIILTFLFVMTFFLLRFWYLHNYLKSLNKKIAFDESLYQSVFEQAPIGIVIGGGKQYITKSEYGAPVINPMFEKIIGRKRDELRHYKWTELTHPDDLEADLNLFDQFKKGEIEGYSMEKRFIRPDGSIVWTNMKISKLIGNLDNNTTHLCLLEDITAKKEVEENLKESERSKSLLISKLPGMAYRCKYDKAWTMAFVSDGCYRLTGYMPESLLNNKDLAFNDLITLEYREPLNKEWTRILAGRLPFKSEYEIITAKGERKWVMELGEGVYDDWGNVVALEGIVLDISDRKSFENHLIYINEHDTLTGLYNRRYLENLLIEDATSDFTGKRAFVGINLSSIHLLSLTYGFYYSQDVVKRVSLVLKTLCNERRQLYSTFVNRFVFYIRGYEDKDELVGFCDEVITALESVLAIERIGGGIGVVEIDKDNMYDNEKIFKNILIATENAISGINADFSCCFYDKAMEDQIIREEMIRNELVSIVETECAGRLFLQFQPIFDLKTDMICGFEALARVRSDLLGLLSPNEFIPIAEKTKLIIQLGRYIISQALGFLKRLENLGYCNINVSINISVIQLMKSDFIKEFLELVNVMGVNPLNVAIEITESVFASNYEEVNDIIGKLQEVGIKISIDDFGTEYSSLVRERELKVNCLKIDKYFTDELLVLKEDEAITADIISMAHKMGHCVIAEGVEDLRQLEYLKMNGCDKIQGYLISEPLDEDVAVEFLCGFGDDSRCN
jgi:PAS domain S-box-containing protein